ncbi:hypothetical protein AAVH_20591 [Aphelenchoides avenae]|nr:hypothetical protein AAVH_20591 [Aphelenchus avenae]
MGGRVAKSCISKLSTPPYTFYALAFLPYNQDSQQCVESIQSPDTGKLIDASQSDLNFFVRYVKLDAPKFISQINSTWQAINQQRSAIVDKVFDSSSEKLCKRLARVLYDRAGVDFEETDSGVRAFAAIKCGYHFVWYELAYAYFPSAATNSPYTFEAEGNGKYDSNCGQLILYP